MAYPPANTLTSPELLRTAATLAEIVKAALVRATFSQAVIGHHNVLTPDGIVRVEYTPDFTQPKNLYYVDRYVVPRAKSVLDEGDKRGQTMAMKQIFGAHALYAVQLGTVENFTFNEITDIIFPERKALVKKGPVAPPNNVIAFPISPRA
jgi:hypothetical protein